LLEASANRWPPDGHLSLAAGRKAQHSPAGSRKEAPAMSGGCITDGALLALIMVAAFAGACGGVAWASFRAARDIESLRRQVFGRYKGENP
jgi:hypothetical protein